MPARTDSAVTPPRPVRSRRRGLEQPPTGYVAARVAENVWVVLELHTDAEGVLTNATPIRNKIPGVGEQIATWRRRVDAVREVDHWVMVQENQRLRQLLQASQGAPVAQGA